MSGRLFSKRHIWIETDGNTASIGITDFLQDKLGAIIFINLPETGGTIKKGEPFGDIESKKLVMDLEAPVDGEVVEINSTLQDEPYLINEEPFESWFIKVRVESIPDDLITEEAYNERITYYDRISDRDGS